MGTTGGKSASWWAKWTNQILIAMNQLDYKLAHLFSTRVNSLSKSDLCVACISGHLTSTTKSTCRALIPCFRNASRIALLKRFRCVARGSVLLLAIIPSLALFLPLRRKKTLKYLSEMASACTTRSKPSSRNRRCAAVNSVLTELLDSESCTASGATSPNNGAAPSCFHAYQKTMGTFPFGY